MPGDPVHGQDHRPATTEAESTTVWNGGTPAGRFAPRRSRDPKATPWLALLALAGCGGAAALNPPGRPPDPEPPPEPARVVAEFLDAANRRDLAAMASRFGTGDGPIGETGGAIGCGFRRIGSWIGLGERCLTAEEVELRMDLMAAILAHRSYRVGGQAEVAGRGRPARRIEVELEASMARGVAVPFILIWTRGGRWLVEEVGLGRLTRNPATIRCVEV